MTVGTTLSAVTLEGNGLTTSFDYPFIMPAASDAVVIYTDATGNQTTLLNTQFTIAGLGIATGGAVTYPLSGSPIATGTFLTIQRVLPLVQTTSVSSQGPTFAAIESELDYIMMCLQQENTDQLRALTGNLADPVGLNYAAPPVNARALQVMGWDSGGNVIATQPSSAPVSTAMQPVVAATSRAKAAGLLGVKVAVNVLSADYGGGADPTGTTDSTAAINLAMAAAFSLGAVVYFPSGRYKVSNTGLGHCILNPGVWMEGESTQNTIIFPAAGTTEDVLVIKPPANGDIGFMSLTNFLIDPKGSGGSAGNRAIYFNFLAVCNLDELHISGVYCKPGGSWSLYFDNDPAVNLQGNPSNSLIERSAFWEGSTWSSVGDSVTIRNCVFRSTAGSNRAGVFALVQTSVSSGTGSQFIVEQNNFDCAGAAVWMLNGRNVKVICNNIESSFGVGSGSGACVDIDGSSGAIPMPEVKGNHVGIFGTSTVGHAIRVNGAIGCDIDNNTILAGITVTDGILLTGSADTTYVGLNEINNVFTNAVNNAGINTRGVTIPLTLLNSFANAGGGYATAAYWQTKDGTVILVGLIDCPATPNGKQICALAGRTLPPLNRIFPAYGLIGPVVSPQAVIVASTGAVTFSGDNTTAQVSLDGITFPTITGIVATL